LEHLVFAGRDWLFRQVIVLPNGQQDSVCVNAGCAGCCNGGEFARNLICSGRELRAKDRSFTRKANEQHAHQRPVRSPTTTVAATSVVPRNTFNDSSRPIESPCNRAIRSSGDSMGCPSNSSTRSPTSTPALSAGLSFVTPTTSSAWALCGFGR